MPLKNRCRFPASPEKYDLVLPPVGGEGILHLTNSHLPVFLTPASKIYMYHLGF